MNVTVVGTGYVGLVSGTCLADFGHTVVCVDQDADRIAALNAGALPFYEPGLLELLHKNAAARRLAFSTDLGGAVSQSAVVFLAVGTPQAPDGSVDLSQLMTAVADVAPYVPAYCAIVTKSTVPVGTGARIEQIVSRLAPAGRSVDVVSNPEFLREGSAVGDFMRPDRVVVGTRSRFAAGLLRELYRPLFLIETPIVETTIETAEMIKYASNAFLAVKIGFVNEIANLCDCVDADVHVVAKVMGLDRRIGAKFLHPGPGYGGSCFPKDTRALAATGNQHGVPQRIVETAIAVNEQQQERLVEKILGALGAVHAPSVAILGLAFKPNTSDVRESPALFVCRHLVRAGVTVRAFDPVAGVEAARALDDIRSGMTYTPDAYEAIVGADALIIMTEWNEFRSLDLRRVLALMRRPILIDPRNVLDPIAADDIGFTYICTGRQALLARASTTHQPALVLSS
jgi:UDPglucose 6-dehydrogenase